MLDIRPTCEHCDANLGFDALNARICTFECTFCAACADEVLGGVCPNCSGELVPRPIRPAAMVAVAPVSTARVSQPVDLDAHAERRASRPVDADHPGVVLRRYCDAWLAGDLTTLLGCYDESFTLHYFGASRFAGSHVGAAAIEALANVSAVAQRELLSVDDLMVSDDGALVVVSERLTRDDEQVTLTRSLRYRVEHGRLLECWLYEHDQAAVDHFWR